jgi:hypothetical protein
MSIVQELLANMLPTPQYAEALLLQGTIVDELEDVTLLYSDMVGFTALSATMKPVDSCIFLNKVYSAFDKHLDSFGVYKMDTVGDAFIVIGGMMTMIHKYGQRCPCVHTMLSRHVMHARYIVHSIDRILSLDILSIVLSIYLCIYIYLSILYTYINR